jgi:hypothetical protein
VVKGLKFSISANKASVDISAKELSVVRRGDMRGKKGCGDSDGMPTSSPVDHQAITLRPKLAGEIKSLILCFFFPFCSLQYPSPSCLTAREKKSSNSQNITQPTTFSSWPRFIWK